jgi:molybdate transport system ATP-binding protein
MIHLDFRLPLHAFTLEMSAGLSSQVTAILGPSGSGKTSLLEVIAGLRKGAVGRIVVEGDTFLDSSRGIRLPPEKRGIGYVPQEPGLFPHLDVRGNIRYGLRGSPGESSRVDETVSLLEIGSLAERYPRTLSGGEAQRVALARALVTRPRMLLLDEPLAALDAELKGRILPYLMKVRDAAKIPMLYVTHHAGEALTLAQEAIVLQAGRVEAMGPVRDVLTPKRLEAVHSAATFENIVHGLITEVEAESGMATLVPAGGSSPITDAETPLTLAVPSAGDLRVGARPTYRVASEDVLLLRSRPQGISARNVFPAQVIHIDAVGHDALVRLDAQGTEWRALLTPAAVRELEIVPHRELWIAIKTHAFQRLG